MAMPRESTFLPTIKCSSCGRQVEISMMGEHICTGEPDAPPVPSMPTNEPDFSRYEPSSPDYGHVPPRVDTGAANRPFLRNDQLIPGSPSSGAQTVSPRTPTGQSGLGQMGDYFAPQIAGEDSMASPAQGRRPGGYGGFGDQEMYDGSRGMEKRPNNDSVMQRIGNIAPGPFDGSRTSSPGNRMLTQSPAPMDRSGTPSSQGNGSMAPPRAPRKDGYGGFGPRSTNSDFDNGTPRSETFPRPSLPMAAPERRPSAPAFQSEQPRPASSASRHMQRPSMGPDTSRPPPPRTSGLLAHKQQNPSHSSVDLAAEFGIGNPYHTPSDSGSSGYSSQSNQPSYASSQTSPTRSQPPRTPTDMGDMTRAMNDFHMGSSLKVDQAYRGPLHTPSPRLDSPYAPSFYGSSPKDILFPPNDLPMQDGLRTPNSPRSFSQSPRSPGLYPASPQDRPDTRWFDTRPFEPQRSETLPSPRQPQGLPMPSRKDSLPELRRDAGQGMEGASGSLPSPSMLPPPLAPRAERKSSRDPGMPSSRGDCKSCRLPIKGKSISSADGRLTGKYHKACFVCTTCSEPFTSAEFYVLDDKPFCGRHYHKLNGSLCGSCKRGIEGQYLADEASIKYHVGCFRCLDCGQSLSNGYFEVEGRAYCERDAARRVAPPPTRSPGGMGEPNQYSQGGRPPNPRLEPPRPPRGFGGGLPAGPRAGVRPPYGKPRPGQGIGPGMGMGPGMGLAPPRPLQMNKRMTRLGMM
ncbi:hypothetical protein B0I35DRAFT_127317 [Stachybotrys elegans]|uniref:LIM zinc-binding domain-containing protein n=1 Tax=Stachybotrys elegans TaxID=80388 RepID=A0A8K0WWS3_9HYPO|nr:hypothetical protein B0I35DRAFT_127317 [Stachybotrys elegans]